MRVGQWFFMTVEHEPHIIGDTGEIKLKDIKLVQDFIIINIRVILGLLGAKFSKGCTDTP